MYRKFRPDDNNRIEYIKSWNNLVYDVTPIYSEVVERLFLYAISMRLQD